MRRVVQKRAEDADRRKREATLKAEADSVADEEKKSLEKRNAEDRERLARETKVHGRILFDMWSPPTTASSVAVHITRSIGYLIHGVEEVWRCCCSNHSS